MKKISFVSASGKVVTVECATVVNTRKLDAIADETLMLDQLWRQAQALNMTPHDYRPTMAVYKRLDNN